MGSVLDDETLRSGQQVIHPDEGAELGAFGQAVDAKSRKGSSLVWMLTLVLIGDAEQYVAGCSRRFD